MMPPETDSSGFVTPKPVVSWGTQRLDPLRILLAIAVLQRQPGEHTGYSERIQLELTPMQCASLAETLTRAALGAEAEVFPPTAHPS